MKRFLSGGCVRDAMWGCEPQDYDLIIFNPDRIIIPDFIDISDNSNDIFREKRTGFEYKVIYEPYTPSRVIDDLKDRDFTINAIAFMVNDFLPHRHFWSEPNISKIEIIDPCNGRIDIKNKVLRMISDDNIKKDPIRILRGFRLMADKGLSVHPDTIKSFHRYKKLLYMVKHGYVYEQLSRVKNLPVFIKILQQYDFIQTIFPFSGPVISSSINIDNLLVYLYINTPADIFKDNVMNKVSMIWLRYGFSNVLVYRTILLCTQPWSIDLFSQIYRDPLGDNLMTHYFKIKSWDDTPLKNNVLGLKTW